MIAAGAAHRDSSQRSRANAEAFASATDVDSAFEVLHAAVRTRLHADTLFLALYDEVSRTIEVVRQAEFEQNLPGGTFPLGRGPTSEVIRTRRSRLIRHWSTEAPPVQVQYLTGRPELPESALTVPVVFDNRVLGVIAVQKYRADGFDENDLAVLEAIAGSIAKTLSLLRKSERVNGQLRERISELEAVLSTMADPVLLVDTEGRLVRLNEAARSLLCRDDASVVLGQPLEREVGGRWPLGASEVAGSLRPMLDALGRGETPPEIEVHLERGGRQILSFKGTPLFERSGEVCGGVLVVRDVTTQHEVEKLKDEMLSIASHDLRTPVTVIRSEAQYMRRQIARGTTSMSEVDEGLQSVVKQTDRLSKLLSLLLDVSRIQARRFEIYRSRVDLSALASRTVAEIQSTTDRHVLDLAIEGKVTGFWDERRLVQVLENLLTNAIKYSPNGGCVRVSMHGDEDTVKVAVTDEGIGLTPEEAEHVFERYFRAHSSRRLEGSGLGLYICQSIVAAHGGQIWAESPGRNCGSSFIFELSRGEPRSDD